MAIASIDPHIAHQQEHIEAMHHLSDTFRLVNKKLSGTEAASDTTIAAVVGMIQYQRIRRDYHHGQVHLEGVERMVQLRGGMAQLMQVTSGLAQKVLR